MEEEGGDVLGYMFVGMYGCVSMNGDVCMDPSEPSRGVLFHEPSKGGGWEPGNSDHYPHR